MKILKESNEKLPLAVVTDYVSRAWEEIGRLRSEIEAIKGFKGSKEVEDILQRLTDAYLICVGQLEGFLQDKNYIKEPVTENLKEAIDIHIDENNVTVADNSGEDAVIIPINADEQEEVKKPTEAQAEIEEPEKTTFADGELVGEPITEPCDFFCDFDDPEPTREFWTDKDIEELQKRG